MISEESYVYIFFPIMIIIWGVYSFFDENDREYLRRNGIDPDEISWFFSDYGEYGAVRSTASPLNQNSTPRTYPARKENTQYARYAPYEHNYDYKGMKDKCKRNFKITISKDSQSEDESNS